MHSIFVEQRFLNDIKGIIQNVCPQAVIWAYGSRVGGDAHAGSDLDLVIKDFGQDKPCLSGLREAFQESNIPFLIEISYFDRLPKNFQVEIEKKHVVLYDGQA